MLHFFLQRRNEKTEKILYEKNKKDDTVFLYTINSLKKRRKENEEIIETIQP